MRNRIHLLMCACILGYAAPFSHARGVETILYNGDSPKTDVRVKWGSWGGGEVEKSDKYLYDLDAKESLHVRTFDLFQGVRLDVTPPVDLAPYKDRGYIIIRMRFPDAPTPESFQPGGLGTGGPGIGGPGIGGPGIGGKSSSRMAPAGGSGYGGAGGPGLPGAGAGSPVGPGVEGMEGSAGLQFLRVTLFLERGAIGVARYEVDFDDEIAFFRDTDIDPASPTFGWTSVRIPLKQFRASAGASGKVKRVVIAGDQEDEFYLGQVKLVQDTQEMSVRLLVNGKPVPERIVGNKRLLQFEAVEDDETTIDADVDAGAADPDVLWNLNEDSKLPPKRGLRIKEMFRESGQFDGWIQIEDASRSDERKEPWRYRIRIIVKKPK